MVYFANYKNGNITINSHRFSDATVTTIDDIVNAYNSVSLEILVASINTESELDKIRGLIV